MSKRRQASAGLAHTLVLAVVEAQDWPTNAITTANLLPGDAKPALSTTRCWSEQRLAAGG